MLSDPLTAGLASAYFLVSFLFAGYVLKVYIELRAEIQDLVHRLDTFKYLEEVIERGSADVARNLVYEEQDDA